MDKWSEYQNAPHEQVNWAALAQQWMAMKNAEDSWHQSSSGHNLVNMADVNWTASESFPPPTPTPPPPLFKAARKVERDVDTRSNFHSHQQQPRRPNLPSGHPQSSFPPFDPRFVPHPPRHPPNFDNYGMEDVGRENSFAPPRFPHMPPGARLPPGNPGLPLPLCPPGPPMHPFPGYPPRPGPPGHSGFPFQDFPPGHFMLDHGHQHPNAQFMANRPPHIVPPAHQNAPPRHFAPPPCPASNSNGSFSNHEAHDRHTSPVSKNNMGPPERFSKNKYREHRNKYENDRSPSPPSSIALDANARKKLPAWLLEGLEKSEREKQKQLGKEEKAKKLEEEKAKKRSLEGRSKFESSSEDEEGGNSPETENRKCSWKDDEVNETAGEDYRTEDEKREDAIIALKYIMTSLLMDATDGLLMQTIEHALHESQRKEVKAVPKLLANSSALAALSNLGDDDDDDDSSDAESKEGNSSSDHKEIFKVPMGLPRNLSKTVSPAHREDSSSPKGEKEEYPSLSSRQNEDGKFTKLSKSADDDERNHKRRRSRSRSRDRKRSRSREHRKKSRDRKRSRSRERDRDRRDRKRSRSSERRNHRKRSRSRESETYRKDRR